MPIAEISTPVKPICVSLVPQIDANFAGAVALRVEMRE
jgi:hypothetical protein